MKITKTNIDVFNEKRKRDIANISCNVCPCCGESMNFLDAIKSGNYGHRGISSYPIRVSVKKGWFSQEYKTIIKYHCDRCGAEWQSEPY